MALIPFKYLFHSLTEELATKPISPTASKYIRVPCARPLPGRQGAVVIPYVLSQQAICPSDTI